MQVTILGCGGSGGVPMIGCRCTVCTSDNPKNKRTRSSILIEVDGKRLLVDTSPDLRAQALGQGLSQVNGILYTHAHADHIHGIDDARYFNYNMKKSIQVCGTEEIINYLNRSFNYAFQMPAGSWVRPVIEARVIEEYSRFAVAGVPVQSFLQYHGKGKTTGYRIGNFAYSTDVNNLNEQSLQLLESLDVWVVDCLQYEPAPTHAHLAMTLEWIEKLKPRRAVLTHMGHAFDYDTLSRALPPNVTPAYDGMKLAISA
jgi:phosphoribosyl 1,2-cyclic phosphate phosphodiesterase